MPAQGTEGGLKISCRFLGGEAGGRRTLTLASFPSAGLVLRSTDGRAEQMISSSVFLRAAISGFPSGSCTGGSKHRCIRKMYEEIEKNKSITVWQASTSGHKHLHRAKQTQNAPFVHITYNEGSWMNLEGIKLLLNGSLKFHWGVDLKHPTPCRN